MGHFLEISIAGRKCLCVPRKVASRSKHFDIILLVPMFYLKLCKNRMVGKKGNKNERETLGSISHYLPIVNQRNENYNNNRVPGAAGGSKTNRFQQSASTNAGAEEKETLNINVVEKKRKGGTIVRMISMQFQLYIGNSMALVFLHTGSFFFSF